MGNDVGGLSYLNPGKPWVRIVVGEKGVYGEDVPQRSIATDQVLRSMRVNVYADSYAENVTLELFDPSYDEIETLLFTTKRVKLPVINVAWGWEGYKAPRTEFRQYEVTMVKTDYQADGTSLTIEGGIRGSTISQHSTEERTFPAGSLPSDVAQTIIQELLGLDAEVEKSLPYQEPITLRKGMSPWAFLRDLATKAVPASGASDQYVFVLAGEKGYFVTKTQVARMNNDGYYRTYIFQHDAQGTMLEFAVEENSAFVSASGGFYNEGGFYDSLQKVFGVGTFTREEVHARLIAGGNRVLRVDGDGVTGRYIPTPLQTKEELDTFLRWKTNEVAKYTLQAKAKVVGDPNIKSNPYLPVKIVFMKRDGTLHPSSGLWWISQTSHVIEASGSYTTELELYRYGTNRGDKVVSTLTLESDIPEYVNARDTLADPNYNYQKRTVITERLPR